MQCVLSTRQPLNTKHMRFFPYLTIFHFFGPFAFISFRNVMLIRHSYAHICFVFLSLFSRFECVCIFDFLLLRFGILSHIRFFFCAQSNTKVNENSAEFCGGPVCSEEAQRNEARTDEDDKKCIATGTAHCARLCLCVCLCVLFLQLFLLWKFFVRTNLLYYCLLSGWVFLCWMVGVVVAVVIVVVSALSRALNGKALHMQFFFLYLIRCV